jgi:HK97 gp10 family phage protein
MNVKLAIEGVDLLEKKLKDIQKAELRARKRALLAGGNVIRNKARSLVRVRTGKLKRGIIVKINKDGTEAKIGPSKRVFYGSFVELGTKIMPAFPYLEPAYRDTKDEAIQKFIDAEREELNKL